MSIQSRRVLAAVLALTAGFVGVWAEFAPKAFNDSFPLPGHHWVSPLGPYNEHVTRDVGGLYLALLVVSVWVVVRPQAERFAMVGLAWLAFSVPHLVFHLSHLGMFGTADKVGNVVSLAGTVVLAALLVVPSRGESRAMPGRRVGAVTNGGDHSTGEVD